ncbi:hypothetical protein [Dyella japonica]|uniref:Phage baseplate protein n=1 Tax=Dyella japonica DSM 16301 TaxID=1440762 RepID=A0A0G9HEX8_9GAMM|nr:hypothetical protein [Dyella japonica]KLD66172.1 hypothetical protein Y882_00400 [Dyella japonica DSM 16301]
MHTPTASELLQAWERGAESSAAARGLWLLDASCEDLDAQALLALPLGRRDALLLELRKRLFGRCMHGVACCPACGATAEVDLDVDALRQEAQASDGTSMTEEREIRELHVDGREEPIRYRLPDSRDLLAMQASEDAASARRLLIRRCVIDAGNEASEADALPLSDAVELALARAMAEADPQTDLSLAFTCPDCRQQWEPAFDVARFLWQELHAWALRLLRDVDTLARSYHWSEAEILAMSPRRRQAYLEQCVS